MTQKEPLVKKSSFWADLRNMLALRPVYREPVRKEIVTEEITKDELIAEVTARIDDRCADLLQAQRDTTDFSLKNEVSSRRGELELVKRWLEELNSKEKQEQNVNN